MDYKEATQNFFLKMRGDEVHMYPLTFAEFMAVYEGEKGDHGKRVENTQSIQ
jgi:predicted AAA+ superfamily ATPase